MSSLATTTTTDLPSTKTLGEGVDTLRDNLREAKYVPGVDSTGRRVIEDTATVLKDFKDLLIEKNPDDKFQQFISESQKAATDVFQDRRSAIDTFTSTGEVVDVDSIKALGEKLLETSRLAAMELMSSSSFRRTVREFIALCADIVDSSLVDVKSRSKEPEETRDEKWDVNTTGERRHPMLAGKYKYKEKIEQPEKPEKPEQQQQQKQKPAQQQQKPAQQQQQQKPEQQQQKPAQAQQQQKPAQAQQQQKPAQAQQQQKPEQQQQKSAQQQQKPGQQQLQAPPKVEEMLGAAREKFEGAVNVGLQKLGSDQRVALSDKQLDELFNRFVAIIQNICERERTKEVFLGILEMFELASEQLTKVTEKGQEAAEKATSEINYNRHVRKSLSLAKELFERFTGDNSLKPLYEHINAFYAILLEDKEKNKFFADVRDYIKRVIADPSLLSQNETYDEGKNFVKMGNALFVDNKELRDHLQGCIDCVAQLMRNIRDDPYTRKLKNDMRKLITDVALDKDGSIVLKENVVEQLRLIIVYSIIERMKIPLPTIYVIDESAEYKLRDIVLSVHDLLPERVVVEDRGRLELKLTDPQHPDTMTSNTLRFLIENVQVHLKDVPIWFKRKTFPQVEDTGKAFIDIGGKGIDISVMMLTGGPEGDFFRVDDVAVFVHELSISLAETKHDWIYNVVVKMLQERVRKALEHAIQLTLLNYLETLNRMLKKQLSKVKQATTGSASITDTIKEEFSSFIGS